jgi:hypothetical protein
MRRPSCNALILAALLTPLAWQPAAAPAFPVDATQAEVVEGQGWKTKLACVACIGGGIYLLTRPDVVIIAALAKEGSAIVAATCVATCIAAVVE